MHSIPPAAGAVLLTDIEDPAITYLICTVLTLEVHCLPLKLVLALEVQQMSHMLYILLR